MVENKEEKSLIVEEQNSENNAPMSYDDGLIKVNLAELNKPKEDTIPEQRTDDSVLRGGNEIEERGEETVLRLSEVESENVEKRIEDVRNEAPIIEEIKEETENLTAKVEEAITESKETGIELPENIQKVVDFINETGGSLEDYVKLNTDYSKLNESQLLIEYYESTKPYLDKEDIDVLMEEFSYDEDIDDERDIRKRKLAFKEETAKAKNHLEGLKNKYYQEIKSGSKLNPEQQKAVEFFNRYNKENQEVAKIAEKQVSTFKDKTEKLFSNDFKGFDFNVGEKKFKFNVNNADKVKVEQSDINNFVKKFLNENNEMSDAAGYHKSLFTAMNPDAIANHFYEQGKADAIKDTMAKAKNIDMDPRGTHENVKTSNGWSVKAISSGENSSRLRIKTRN